MRRTAGLQAGHHVAHCSVCGNPSGDEDAQLALVILLQLQCETVHSSALVVLLLLLRGGRSAHRSGAHQSGAQQLTGHGVVAVQIG